jgi:serine/threonine-protein kinase
MVGDCVVQKPLGEGGMGVVYLVHQVSLDRPAALKVLHTQFAENERYIREFISEARAAARLNHPNIVQAYAVGEDDGIYYIVMEYVEGSTLKDILLHGGRLVVARALDIATEVAKALDYAWTAQKLVHRDIKPDNIILTRDAGVKLADLGLARLVGDVRKEDGAELFGTPQYISPEQLLGEIGDNRSDIYSLGATFYHALTGQFPFAGDSPAAIAKKHLSEPLTPPDRLVSDIPAEVSLVIQIMMSKRAGDRYGDAAELMGDLERVTRGEAPGRAPATDSQAPIEVVEIQETTPAPAGPPAAPKPTLSAAQVTAAEPSAATPPPPSGRRLKVTTKSGSQPIKVVVRQDGGEGAQTVPGVAVEPSTEMEAVHTAVMPDAAEEASVPVVEESGTKRGIGFLTALLCSIGGGVVLAALFTAGVYLASGRGGGDVAVDAGPAPDVEEASEEQQAAYDTIAGLVGSGASSEAILSQAATFFRTFPEEGPLHGQLRDLVAPAVEGEIRSLREIRRRDDMAEWAKEAARLQEAARAAEAEKEKLAAEEAARRVAEAAEKLKAKQREQYLAKMREEQDRLRWEAVKLCEQHKYSDALMVFASLTSSRDQQFRDWAASKQKCIEYAEKAFNMVYNSGEKLRGVKLPLPGSSPKLRIYFVGRRKIDVAVRSQEYVGDDMIEKWADRDKVEFSQVPASVMWELCKTSWGKDEGDPQELDLYFGAYLLAAGQRLDVAQAKLESCGMSDEAAPLLKELAVMAPAVMSKEWDRYREHLQVMLDKGDRQSVEKLVQILKLRYPQLYSKYEQDIQSLLQQE